MNRSLFASILAGALATAACGGGKLGGGPSYHFGAAPSAPQGLAPATMMAVEIQTADRAALEGVGGQIIGTLHVQIDQTSSALAGPTSAPNGNKLTPQAAREGAEHGATHFTYDGDTSDARVSFTHVVGTKDHTVVGKFTMWRVEPARWAELPEKLRPAPATSATLTSASASQPK